MEVTRVLSELWDTECRRGNDLRQMRLQPEGGRRAEIQGHDAHDERRLHSGRPSGGGGGPCIHARCSSRCRSRHRAKPSAGSLSRKASAQGHDAGGGTSLSRQRTHPSRRALALWGRPGRASARSPRGDGSGRLPSGRAPDTLWWPTRGHPRDPRCRRAARSPDGRVRGAPRSPRGRSWTGSWFRRATPGFRGPAAGPAGLRGC